jgi:hypothetical protein
MPIRKLVPKLAKFTMTGGADLDASDLEFAARRRI